MDGVSRNFRMRFGAGASSLRDLLGPPLGQGETVAGAEHVQAKIVDGQRVGRLRLGDVGMHDGRAVDDTTAPQPITLERLPWTTIAVSSSMPIPNPRGSSPRLAEFCGTCCSAVSAEAVVG
jgi:hypothetical protein